MQTVLTEQTQLPLTCTCSGACCHDKTVPLNPAELAFAAAARGLPPEAFAQAHTTNLTHLKFEPVSNVCSKHVKNRCGQLGKDNRCLIHPQRPYACRLYPLGHKRQGEVEAYVHEGGVFPCIAPCPGVLKLPQMTVAAYLKGQEVGPWQAAHNRYLELVQDLSEGAFIMALETGLYALKPDDTVAAWQQASGLILEPKSTDPLQKSAIDAPWLYRLFLPEININENTPDNFAQQHAEMLQQSAQEAFATLTEQNDHLKTSAMMHAMALKLALALGVQAADLAVFWVKQLQVMGERS